MLHPSDFPGVLVERHERLLEQYAALEVEYEAVCAKLAAAEAQLREKHVPRGTAAPQAWTPQEELER